MLHAYMVEHLLNGEQQKQTETQRQDHEIDVDRLTVGVEQVRSLQDRYNLEGEAYRAIGIRNCDMRQHGEITLRLFDGDAEPKDPSQVLDGITDGYTYEYGRHEVQQFNAVCEAAKLAEKYGIDSHIDEYAAGGDSKWMHWHEEIGLGIIKAIERALAEQENQIRNQESHLANVA